MLCRLMLIKFNSFDRAEKTVGSTGTIQENLFRQVKEERDNTTHTHTPTVAVNHAHPHMPRKSVTIQTLDFKIQKIHNNKKITGLHVF